jgi:hypothetical protein
MNFRLEKSWKNRWLEYFGACLILKSRRGIMNFNLGGYTIHWKPPFMQSTGQAYLLKGYADHFLKY